jgi:hypothetical protein
LASNPIYFQNNAGNPLKKALLAVDVSTWTGPMGVQDLPIFAAWQSFAGVVAPKKKGSTCVGGAVDGV